MEIDTKSPASTLKNLRVVRLDGYIVCSNVLQFKKYAHPTERIEIQANFTDNLPEIIEVQVCKMLALIALVVSARNLLLAHML